MLHPFLWADYLCRKVAQLYRSHLRKALALSPEEAKAEEEKTRERVRKVVREEAVRKILETPRAPPLDLGQGEGSLRLRDGLPSGWSHVDFGLEAVSNLYKEQYRFKVGTAYGVVEVLKRDPFSTDFTYDAVIPQIGGKIELGKFETFTEARKAVEAKLAGGG